MGSYGRTTGGTGPDTGGRAVARLAEALSRETEELSQIVPQRILAEVPGYRLLAGDVALANDIRAHSLEQNRRLFAWLQTDAGLKPEDFMFMRPHTAQRVGRVSYADLTQTFLLSQTVLWEAVSRLAPGRASQAAAVELFGRMTSYFRVATTVGTEAYLETAQMLAGTGEQVRLDALEGLLAQRDLGLGPPAEAARAAGLEEGTPLMALVATPTERNVDPHVLRSTASVFARASQARLLPLTALRGGEIVILVPLSSEGGSEPREYASRFGARIEVVHEALASRGLPMAIGISTPHEAFAGIATAYREACDARDSLLPDAGVLSLSSLSAFEYLTTHADPVARRLVSARVAAFIDEEKVSGGGLVETLRTYAGANMNAKQTAELLNVHVNTIHYRLGRIAERTGCDVHSVDGIIELLIAARLSIADH